ncbi:MAG: type II toxin-antitoxin system RelE/ParE family toxin [Candidatus Ureaplasma intestinipullorum]|uniref:Type II toxin-antitoxin system RelE/ParE family toxin n=1 Tax=Candidatus Ureaplasma intestinipullorum TaxID=2838770 RepID=A0A9E2NY01_9BACT|nr:type II toxin-antitoxin system RelE/ParE family toxin [Candidatus Ureaplasma intestinipullorum]
MYKTIFFKKTITKKCLVLDYLQNDIPKSTMLKIIEQMKLLEIYGIKPGYVKIKKFQNEMFKIRLNDGNNNCRVYFILIDGVIYYLFGYNKKTQKTAEGIKVKINNLKVELLNQIQKHEDYLFDYIDLNKKVF